MSDDIENEIKEMIVERCFLTVPPEEIDSAAPLMDSLGLDSVQILEVIVGLEEVFGVTFEDSDFDLKNFSSVTAIADYVRKKAPAAK